MYSIFIFHLLHHWITAYEHDGDRYLIYNVYNLCFQLHVCSNVNYQFVFNTFILLIDLNARVTLV